MDIHGTARDKFKESQWMLRVHVLDFGLLCFGYYNFISKPLRNCIPVKVILKTKLVSKTDGKKPRRNGKSQIN